MWNIHFILTNKTFCELLIFVQTWNSILFTKFIGEINTTSIQKSWFNGILKQELCEYKLSASTHEKKQGTTQFKLKNEECRSEMYIRKQDFL